MIRDLNIVLSFFKYTLLRVEETVKLTRVQLKNRFSSFPDLHFIILSTHVLYPRDITFI